MKNDILGLKWGQDLVNQAAHPHQEFQGVLPREVSILDWELIVFSFKGTLPQAYR